MDTLSIPTTTPAVNYLDPVFSLIKREQVNYGSRGTHVLPMTIFSPIDSAGNPVGDKKKPTVIVLHAGGATFTDNDPETTALYFAARGWIGVSVEYQNTLEGRQFSAEQCLLNTFAALRWLRINHKQYGVKRSNMFAVGRSAGGITAAHMAVVANNLTDPEFSSDEMMKVNLFYEDGVTPVKNRINGAASFSGCIEPGDFKFIDADDSPWYDYHGEDDTTVPIKKSQNAVNEVKAAGIDTNLMSFPGTDHHVGHYDIIMADMVPRLIKLFKD